MPSADATLVPFHAKRVKNRAFSVYRGKTDKINKQTNTRLAGYERRRTFEILKENKLCK
jgi:hypothetical protein